MQLADGSFTDVAAQDGDQLVRGWENGRKLGRHSRPDSGRKLQRREREIHQRYWLQQPSPKRSAAQPRISPQATAAPYVKYNIDNGPLKGLFFNALVTHVASTPTQAPNAGDTTAIVGGKSVVTAHTDAWKLHLPSFTLWNFGVHYMIPRGVLGPKWNERIDVNLNNAFNQYYLKTSALRGDSRSVLVQITLTHSGYHF